MKIDVSLFGGRYIELTRQLSPFFKLISTVTHSVSSNLEERSCLSVQRNFEDIRMATPPPFFEPDLVYTIHNQVS